jgi:hypothetical protein
MCVSIPPNGIQPSPFKRETIKGPLFYKEVVIMRRYGIRDMGYGLWDMG